MDSTQLIMAIFGALGIIFVILIIYYVLARWYISNQISQELAEENYPSRKYNEMVGSVCPDYWEQNQQSSFPGMNVCNKRPEFNIENNNDTSCAGYSCFDNNSTSQKSFPSVTNFPITSRSQVEEQCKWLNCCQIKNPLPSSSTSSLKWPWLAIQDKCGL